MSNAQNVSKLHTLAAHLGNLIGLANSKAAIDAKIAEASPVTTSVLPGTVFDYAGSTAPDGYLLAAGQVVSRATYAALFAVVGVTYGAGDGSTTFQLPDLRGRVVAGADNMGGTAASRLTSGGSGVNGGALGSSGGAETHTLTSAQIPAHTHTATSDTHAGHSHGSITDTSVTWTNATNDPTGTGTGTTGWGTNLTTSSTTRTSGTGGSHSHVITVANNTGGGNAHNITQPTIILNKIIKT